MSSEGKDCAMAYAATEESNASKKEPENSKHFQNDGIEDWEVQRDAHKKAGDDAFRSGDFSEAIVQYTNGLSLDPTNHLILSNRSAANLKGGHKSKALQDARACTDANPAFAKGHSRLAAAMQSLKRYEPAKSAYAKVILLDPNNQVAKQGMQHCIQQLKNQQQEELVRVKEELLKEQEEKPTAAQESTEKENEAGASDGEDDDLLNDFFSEEETEVKKPKPKPAEIVDEKLAKASRGNVIQLQKTDLGTAESQLQRLLAPQYQWRNLNPFYVLDLPHTSTEDYISKRYKALSLLLHPDKCRSLNRAKEAYDEVQRAKTLLDDEDKSRHARQLVARGHKLGQQEWHKGGEKEHVGEVQSRAVQKIFAEIEHKRREVERRTQKQDQRERQQEEEELQKEKSDRQFDKKWREDNRVKKRIGNWRDFKGDSKKQHM